MSRPACLDDACEDQEEQATPSLNGFKASEVIRGSSHGAMRLEQ